MYYVMRASAPSLHRESTDSLIGQAKNNNHTNAMWHSLHFLTLQHYQMCTCRIQKFQPSTIIKINRGFETYI